MRPWNAKGHSLHCAPQEWLREPILSAEGGEPRGAGEQGFTLIETMISIVIMVVSILGMASLFTYSINYNSGADLRQQAMSVAQQRMERLRDMKFTDSGLNATSSSGVSETVTAAGRQFNVVTIITNTPSSGTPVSKSITIQVTPLARGANWIRSSVTLQTVRTTAKVGTN